MKKWGMLIVMMLMAGPVFAEQTKAELIAEYNRLETLKQIILRQSDIAVQIKMIDEKESLEKTANVKKKKEKAKK